MTSTRHRPDPISRAGGSSSRRVAMIAAATGLAAGAGLTVMAAHRAGTSMSLLLARTILRLIPKVLRDAAAVRRRVAGRPYPREAPLPASLRRRCGITSWDAEGQSVVTLVPHEGASDWHILYLHGGAFINPMSAAHWSIVRALIDATGASVTVPFYALAPEHDHRPGTALVDAVYAGLAATRANGRLMAVGDSAGGNMALSLVLRLRDAGKSLPDRLVLFSPWLDLTHRDERARDLEGIDVMLGVDGLRVCGQWWAHPLDPSQPRFSPLRADLTDLPPIAIFQGDHDIFVIDAWTFVARAEEAGLCCDYVEYPGAFHVFMGATFTPEARDVFARVGRLAEGAAAGRPADGIIDT